MLYTTVVCNSYLFVIEGEKVMNESAFHIKKVYWFVYFFLTASAVFMGIWIIEQYWLQKPVRPDFIGLHMFGISVLDIIVVFLFLVFPMYVYSLYKRLQGNVEWEEFKKIVYVFLLIVNGGSLAIWIIIEFVGSWISPDVAIFLFLLAMTQNILIGLRALSLEEYVVLK